MSAPHVTIDETELHMKDEGKNVVRCDDGTGNSLKLQMIDGVHYGIIFNPEVIRQIQHVELRDDDIYFPSYLRTGTHWTFEMVSMLLNGKAETIKKFKGKNQLEFVTNEELSCLPSPRVLNTHMKLSLSPSQLTERKCKIIFNFRDPKDVAVSLYNCLIDSKDFLEYSGTFENFLHLFYEGKVDCNGLFEYWRDAEKFFDENPEIPVHFQVYEDTLKDPLREVQALSDFIGLPRNDELCHAVTEKCMFSNMLRDKDSFSLKVNDKNIFFRKGVVGDWRNWFTDPMLEEYYRVYEEKMAGSRFYERYAQNK